MNKVSIFRVFVLLFIMFYSKSSFSGFWMVHGSCDFPGCGGLRTESLPDYCSQYVAGANSYNNTLPFYKRKEIQLLRVIYTYENMNSPTNIFAQGACELVNVQGGHPFVRGAAAYMKECPAGETYDASLRRCIEKDKDTCKAGNPIDISSGIKLQEEVDYSIRYSNSSIQVKRFYKPSIAIYLRNYLVSRRGADWNFSYTDRLYYSASEFDQNSELGKHIYILIPESKGFRYFYTNDDITWTSKNGYFDRLEKLEENGNIFWRYTRGSEIKKIFNLDGRLVQVNDPKTGILNFEYDNSSVPGSEIMNIKIGDFSLLSYEFTQELLRRVRNSNGEIVASYYYDASRNLSKVEYSEGKKKIFDYVDIGFLKLLSKITDERDVPYATWTYDEQGRAISSEHAGGAEKTLLTFNADGSTTVTNALNKQTIYRFADIAGARRVTKVEGQPTANCVGANQDYTYTPEGWIASETNWKGVKTTFSYNAAGQEISRTEAFGTPEARTTITEWHPTLFVKTKITEPERETVYTYDANGRLLNQTVQSISAQ
jgi:YD repeat-containing protein